MAEVKFQGNPIKVRGEMPKKGTVAPDFDAVKTDLSTLNLSDYKGKKVILNLFPSIDTGVCAQSVRTFNEKATKLDNTVVLCLSKDLPFALARFCGAEGLDNVISGSLFRSESFDKEYALIQEEGPLKGLLARAVIVLDEDGKVIYTQLVPEITEEPNYEEALKAL